MLPMERSGGGARMTEDSEATTTVGDALRRLTGVLPGSVKHRLTSSLDHIDGAFRLFEMDREMASFRAITGEEEAATALIKAIQFRGYEHARTFNPRNHVHKAAVMVCIDAIATTLQPMLGEFRLTFDFNKPRIDVKVPLSSFGVESGADLAVQPVEPLGLVHIRQGINERNVFDDVLSKLAENASFESIKTMVSAAASSRNSLLYASDAAPPKSRATEQSILRRKQRAQTMLILSVMVLQTREHLPMVRQAIFALLGIISRLPAEEAC